MSTTAVSRHALAVLAVATLALALAGAAAHAGDVRDTLGTPGEREPAPSFDLEAVDGTRHTLADYAGKVLVVNFWATWCPPCRAEMPALERAWRALEADGVALVAIDFGEPREDVAAFAAESGVRFPLLLDTRGTEVRRWPLRGLPTTFILDRAGRIVYKIQGERNWDDPAIIEQLRALAREPARG